MKIGDRIVYGNMTPSTNDASRLPMLRYGTITKIVPNPTNPSTTAVYVDSQHRYDEVIYAKNCWPLPAKEELEKIMQARLAIREAYEQSAILLVDLRKKYPLI